VPTWTAAVVAGGHVTLTGTTGEANDQVSIYDGNSWLGFATTGSDGTFNFGAAASPSMLHTYGANATNTAGQEGHGSNQVIIGGTATSHLTGGAGGDILNANGGSGTVMGAGGGPAHRRCRKSDIRVRGHR